MNTFYTHALLRKCYLVIIKLKLFILKYCFNVLIINDIKIKII